MPMNNDLMLAILSMDSYNRGYGQSVLGLSSRAGTQLGLASILQDANDNAGTAKSAGFYAIAYSYGGKTVISYRGTDNFLSNPLGNGEGSDIYNGYGLGVGNPDSPQSLLAVDFLRNVAGGGLAAVQ